MKKLLSFFTPEQTNSDDTNSSLPPTVKKFGVNKKLFTPQVLVGIAVLAFVVVGVIAASVLVKMQQDVRQQASVAQPCSYYGKSCMPASECISTTSIESRASDCAPMVCCKPKQTAQLGCPPDSTPAGNECLCKDGTMVKKGEKCPTVQTKYDCCKNGQRTKTGLSSGSQCPSGDTPVKAGTACPAPTSCSGLASQGYSCNDIGSCQTTTVKGQLDCGSRFCCKPASAAQQAQTGKCPTGSTEITGGADQGACRCTSGKVVEKGGSCPVVTTTTYDCCTSSGVVTQRGVSEMRDCPSSTAKIVKSGESCAMAAQAKCPTGSTEITGGADQGACRCTSGKVVEKGGSCPVAQTPAELPCCNPETGKLIPFDGATGQCGKLTPLHVPGDKCDKTSVTPAAPEPAQQYPCCVNGKTVLLSAAGAYETCAYGLKGEYRECPRLTDPGTCYGGTCLALNLCNASGQPNSGKDTCNVGYVCCGRSATVAAECTPHTFTTEGLWCDDNGKLTTIVRTGKKCIDGTIETECNQNEERCVGGILYFNRSCPGIKVEESLNCANQCLGDIECINNCKKLESTTVASLSCTGAKLSALKLICWGMTVNPLDSKEYYADEKTCQCLPMLPILAQTSVETCEELIGAHWHGTEPASCEPPSRSTAMTTKTKSGQTITCYSECEGQISAGDPDFNCYESFGPGWHATQPASCKVGFKSVYQSKKLDNGVTISCYSDCQDQEKNSAMSICCEIPKNSNHFAYTSEANCLNGQGGKVDAIRCQQAGEEAGLCDCFCKKVVDGITNDVGWNGSLTSPTECKNFCTSSPAKPTDWQWRCPDHGGGGPITFPGEGTPGNGGTPGESTPDDGTPDSGTPGDGTPGGQTPDGGTPGDGTPGDGSDKPGRNKPRKPKDSCDDVISNARGIFCSGSIQRIAGKCECVSKVRIYTYGGASQGSLFHGYQATTLAASADIGANFVQACTEMNKTYGGNKSNYSCFGDLTFYTRLASANTYQYLDVSAAANAIVDLTEDEAEKPFAARLVLNFTVPTDMTSDVLAAEVTKIYAGGVGGLTKDFLTENPVQLSLDLSARVTAYSAADLEKVFTAYETAQKALGHKFTKEETMPRIFIYENKGDTSLITDAANLNKATKNKKLSRFVPIDAMGGASDLVDKQARAEIISNAYYGTGKANNSNGKTACMIWNADWVTQLTPAQSKDALTDPTEFLTYFKNKVSDDYVYECDYLGVY